MRGHDNCGHILNCDKNNNDGNFRSLLKFRASSSDLALKNHIWKNNTF